MEHSTLIAQLLGVLYLAVGFGLLLNTDHYKKAMDKFMKEPAMLYLGGVMALVVGLLMVTFHNVWVKDWQVIITILGWLALIKGVSLLALPNFFTSLFKDLTKSKSFILVGGVFALVLGVVLGYYGYFV